MRYTLAPLLAERVVQSHDPSQPDLQALTPTQVEALTNLVNVMDAAIENGDSEPAFETMYALSQCTPGQCTNRLAWEFGLAFEWCSEHQRDLDGCLDDEHVHAYDIGVPGWRVGVSQAQ